MAINPITWIDEEKEFVTPELWTRFNIKQEWEKTFEEERQRNQTVLFPVRLDEAVMKTDKAWATDIRRTRHIGDFSRWKDHDAYQAAFERLLRDLKAEVENWNNFGKNPGAILSAAWSSWLSPSS